LGQAIQRAKQLGSYRLVELLGKGGMGEVWRAEHHMLARPAAIKLIRPETFGARKGENAGLVLQRFRHEAQATALLDSEHTIHLYDYGATEDGSLYYVMELLDGVDLEELVEQYGPLPAGRVVHLLRQACHSLAEAHAAALIHRDIKPANIFVCRYGLETDFVKVLDFGLVKSRDESAAADPRITADNVAGGTPAYMAPEQVLGLAEIDRRADLYSLGCVAYWLLTGRMVFEASTALEAVNHHLHTAPTAPSKRTELPVPPELDDLVLRCLAKSPEERPPGASQLAGELGALAAAHPWSATQSRDWWEAHRSLPKAHRDPDSAERRRP
jgi:serine/threonine-protein kinase